MYETICIREYQVVHIIIIFLQRSFYDKINFLLVFLIVYFIVSLPIQLLELILRDLI